MNTISKISKTFKTELINIYPEREIQAFIEILLEYYVGFSKTDIILKFENELDTNIVSNIKQALVRLKNNEPVQYIIGETEFYGINIKVNPSVLIPRPETEELVDWIIENHKKNEQINILDIGTGSGCIPIALKNNLTKANVFAIDISEKALETAKINAEFNKLDISFVNLDILKNESNRDLTQFDVIVSNPPYVRQKEKEQMQENVLANEPHLALFVEDNDALVFYKAIISFAKNHLKKNGNLYFEINEAYGKELVALFEKNNYTEIELKQDINGRDRMIKGEK